MEDRQNLADYWTARSDDQLKKYWSVKNAQSIDGFDTGFVPEDMIPAE